MTAAAVRVELLAARSKLYWVLDPGGGAAGLILNKGDLTSNKPVSLTSPHPADEIKLFERLGN